MSRTQHLLVQNAAPAFASAAEEATPRVQQHEQNYKVPGPVLAAPCVAQSNDVVDDLDALAVHSDVKSIQKAGSQHFQLDYLDNVIFPAFKASNGTASNSMSSALVPTTRSVI